MKTSFQSITIEAIKFGRMQHMQLTAWSKRKIWKPKQYKITATLLPRNILQLQLRSQFYSWILHGNIFALANLTTSSKFETRKLHTIIWQLHHITATKHIAATATF